VAFLSFYLLYPKQFEILMVAKVSFLLQEIRNITCDSGNENFNLGLVHTNMV